MPKMIKNHRVDLTTDHLLESDGHVNDFSYKTLPLTDCKMRLQPVNALCFNGVIPRKQIMNVLDFGHEDNVSQLTLEDQSENEEIEERSIKSGAEENFDMDNMRSRASLLEQSSEVDSDLFEQQESIEGVHALKCFEQLRMHQVLQQEELMRRQQEQLKLLYEEDMLTRQKIAQQRQAAWGKVAICKSQLDSGNLPGSSYNQKLVPLGSTLPKDIAQAMLRNVNIGSLINIQSNCAPPVLIQNGRPLPVFQDPTPVLYQNDEDSVDMCVDSESDYVDSQSQIDGICPLPDSGSEVSEIPNQPVLVHGYLSTSGVRKNLYFQNGKQPVGNVSGQITDEICEEAVVKSKLATNLKVNNNCSGLSTVDVISERIRDVRSADLSKSVMLQRYPVTGDKNYLSKQYNFAKNEKKNENGDIVKHATEAVGGYYKSTKFDNKQEQEKNTEEMEEEVEEIDDKVFGIVDSVNYVDNVFDEKPVSGLGNNKKTFEEILEEELKKEETKKITDGSMDVVPQKRAFLRKGEGWVKTVKPSVPCRPRNSPTVANKMRDTRSKGSSLQIKHLPSKDKIPPVKVKVRAMASTRLKLKRPAAEEIKTSRITMENDVPLELGTFGEQLEGKRNSSISKEAISPQNANRSTQASALQHSLINDFVQSKSASLGGASCLPETKSDCSNRLKNTTGAKTTDKYSTPESDYGESSFKKCEEKDAKREDELDELQEFLLLEQYAEDNASFLSNLSRVNQVIDHHKETIKKYANKTANERSGSAEAEKDCSDDDSVVNFSEIAETETSPEKDINDERDNTLVEKAVVCVSSDKAKFRQSPDGQSNQLDKLLVFPREMASNKIQTSEGRVICFQQAEGCSSDTVQKTASQIPNSGASLSMQVVSQNDRLGSAIASDGTTLNASDARNIPHRPDVIESRHVTNGPFFEDNSIWDDVTNKEQLTFATAADDLEKRIVSSSECFPPSSQHLSGNGLTAYMENDQNMEHSPPPVSRLISSLFPKLKSEKLTPSLPSQEQQLKVAKQIEVGDGVQSRLLREKVLELENEIQKFRNKNIVLSRLQKEREEGLELLKKEMAEFEKQKVEELTRLQNFKNEEMKKLRKEKKVFEQYQKAFRDQPNKKEREEIETLKSQLTSLQDDMQKKEQRWMANMTRLRDRIEVLEQENAEMKEENRLLEQRRLEACSSKRVTDTSARSLFPVPMDHSDVLAVQNAACPPSRFRQNNLDPAIKLDISPEVPQLPYFGKLPSAESGPVQDGRRTTLPMAKTDEALSKQLPNNQVLHLSSNSPNNFSGQYEKSVTQTFPRKIASHVGNDVTYMTKEMNKGDGKYTEVQHGDEKVERKFSNGVTEVLFANGTRKQVSADEEFIIYFFLNGDTKEIFPDKREVYYYADAQTTHTNFPDGLEVLEFPNHHIEKHFQDGSKEIMLPDGVIKCVHVSGVEDYIYPDKTKMRVEKNGDRITEFENGQREIRTQKYKRREYPDGTVKTVYSDGHQETQYASGRLRVKDKYGNVILDESQ